MKTTSFRIHAYSIGNVTEAIDKINKKIKRANDKSDIGINLVTCEFSPVWFDDTNRAFCTANITVPELSTKYKYIGFIDHANNMVHTNYEEHTDVMEKYRHNCTCDHCHKNIERTKTFIHLNEDTNDYIHVGGSCSKNYFQYPMSIVHAFVDMFIAIDDIVKAYGNGGSDYESFGYNHGPSYYPLGVVLHTSYNEIKKNGYSKEEFWGDTNCTKFRVKDDISTCNYSSESDLDVDGLIDYINNKEPSGYINNIREITKHTSERGLDEIGVSDKQVGMFPYIIFEYLESLKKHVSTGYYGKPKDKFDIECMLYKHYQYTGDYGLVNIYTFITDDGCHLVWKSSVCIHVGFDDNGVYTDTGIKEGVRVKLTGTIKAHSEYKDEMQTVITRCKVKLI